MRFQCRTLHFLCFALCDVVVRAGQCCICAFLVWWGRVICVFSPLNGALYTFKLFSVKMGKVESFLFFEKNTFSNYVPSEDMSIKI